MPNPYSYNSTDKAPRLSPSFSDGWCKIGTILFAALGVPLTVLGVTSIPTLLRGPDYPDMSIMTHAWLCTWPWLCGPPFILCALMCSRGRWVATAIPCVLGLLTLAIGLWSVVWSLNKFDYPI